MKRKPNLENILTLDQFLHYRSILKLLVEYPKGLEPRHLRYALCENHDRENFSKTGYSDLAGFFKDGRLEQLKKSGFIKEGCIKSKNILTNFLNNLIDKGYIYKSIKHRPWTKNTSAPKIYVYKVSKRARLNVERMSNRKILDLYKNAMIFNSERFDLSRHTLYGISQAMFDSLYDHEQAQIKKSLKNIEKELTTIDLIKGKIVDQFVKYLLSNILKGMPKKISENLKELITITIGGIRVFASFDTFNTPVDPLEEEPTGFPFEFDINEFRNKEEEEQNMYAYELLFQLHYNIIHHREELYEKFNLSKDVGDALFEVFKNASEQIKDRYDDKMISYSYTSQGINDDSAKQIFNSSLI
jgi:hypothetical protein